MAKFNTNATNIPLKAVDANEFPGIEYAAAPSLAFSIEFVSARTLRLRALSGPRTQLEEPSLMLVNGQAPQVPNVWKYSKIEKGDLYKPTATSSTNTSLSTPVPGFSPVAPEKTDR